MSESSALRVIGQLVDNAAVTYTPGIKPAAVLSFEMDLPKGRRVRVVMPLGTDENAHIAADAKKQMLRRGSWAAVHAEGGQEQSDHGVVAFRLLGVSGVYPLPTPAARTVATPTQEAL